jgi:hypothetical protein
MEGTSSPQDGVEEHGPVATISPKLQRIGSSRQGCGPDGVKVPCRQLPGSDG